MIHQILSRGVYVSRYPRGAPWAMLCGIGMQEADMEKAQIGITSVWFEGNTCNMHLIAMARSVNLPLSRNA